MDLMNASMLLPFPTGIETNIPKSDNATIDFFDKYRSILSINEKLIYNRESKLFEVDKTGITLNLILNTPEEILLFKQFLSDILVVTRPTNLLKFAKELMDNSLVSFVFLNPDLIRAIFNELENVVNNHNLYLESLSQDNVTSIVNNYLMNLMYSTISDPVNLIEALTSVDGTTKPLKDIGDKSPEGIEARYRTPGNVFNKFLSIVDNQVGKLGIGICATGLKAFFGLTLYNNYILNNGTAELLERLIISNDHNGLSIGGNVYKLLANIRSKDPNTITNTFVLEALSQTTNDTDAALVLSALLSLATDSKQNSLF